MSSFRPARPRGRSIAALLALAMAVQPLAPGYVSLASAQSLPDLGDESQSLLTPSAEQKLGLDVVHQIRAAGAYLEDPEVNDYLNELGHRLVAARVDSSFDFEFFAINDPSINAFALPGGFVGVNIGVILLAQNESELASVLAHEISHVTQHHMARMAAKTQRSMLLPLAALALALASTRSKSSSSGDMASAAIASAQALAIQNQINYTRENEYEADRIGFQRLNAAGFDVTAMATLMKRLQKASTFADGTAPSYLRTHPITYERVAEAEARAANVPYRQVEDSLDFQMVRALLKSYSGSTREAVAFFDEALAERKFNSEIAARYGLVASLLRAKNYARAKTELARLEKMGSPHPMIDAIAGHVYMDAGDLPAAIARFESALARYPNKMQLVYDYPEALLKARRARDAAAYLEAQLVRFPNDGPLHRIAAQAYAALGLRMQQFRHQGEFYAWRGDLRGAVGQFELASKENDGDFYQTSVVETRLRTLRKELAEQQAALAKNG